jgi:hypothetical protein
MKFSDLSIFSKAKPELLKKILESWKECPACYDLTEITKYEFLKKCSRCNRYRGYKEPVPEPCVAPSLYLMEEDEDYYTDEMILQEMSDESMAQPPEVVSQLDLTLEEIEYIQWCLEDIEEIRQSPLFTDEEVEYLLWCLEV